MLSRERGDEPDGRSAVAAVESGSEVVIRVGQEQEHWTVVAPHESDPLRRRISEMSPLGFALLGRQPGETVTVRGPEPYRVTIVAVGEIV